MSNKFNGPVPCLPLEIVEIIIDHLHNNKRSLAACSLVARSWIAPSRHHFLSSITVEVNTAHRLLTLLDSPHSTLASSVRELKLISPDNQSGQDVTSTLLKFTERFAHLNSLMFMYIAWTRIDPQALDHLRTLSITKLVMCACTFESNTQLFDIVSLFQVLEEFNYLSLYGMTTSGPYSYPSTISPRLRKLVVANERHIPHRLTQWLTCKPLPLLQDVAVEEISCLADAQNAASLIAHAGPTLANLQVAFAREYLHLPVSQLDLSCCSALQIVAISLDIANIMLWTRAVVNISFLPMLIASTTSSSLFQIKLELNVGQMVDNDLRCIPWQDLDTIFASNSTFASLEKVVIELNVGDVLDDPMHKAKAEAVIYGGLERIARRGKLDVQYIGWSPRDYRLADMLQHQDVFRITSMI
ncbi:hypothetical protein BJ912DRAFT_499794 [Pholiota molesta]|nr:hypothetical protein BJ912DRAFT_499794 [Pholiota molesta]